MSDSKIPPRPWRVRTGARHNVILDAEGLVVLAARAGDHQSIRVFEVAVKLVNAEAQVVEALEGAERDLRILGFSEPIGRTAAYDQVLAALSILRSKRKGEGT